MVTGCLASLACGGGHRQVLEIEGRAALLWVGYDLGLDTLALDMMHADFDLVTGLLSQARCHPLVQSVAAWRPWLGRQRRPGLPGRYRRCAGSSLMPRPYGVRGGWRATFTGVVLEYAMRAGFTGEGLAALTEYTAEGENLFGLPAASRPCAAVIDQVLACLAAANLIKPASALAALELGVQPGTPSRRLTGIFRASPSRPAAADLVPSCRSVRLYRLAASGQGMACAWPRTACSIDDEQESHLGDVPGGLDCSVGGALPGLGFGFPAMSFLLCGGHGWPG